MVIGIKDGIKLVGISVVIFCAVFVCTFFWSFYIDATAIEGVITGEMKPLFDAQIAMSQFTCVISGGVLCLIAVVMTVFYIKLFINANKKRFGILKALGYSDGKIAAGFWVFGLSTFIGGALGYCAGLIAMPTIYRGLTVDGLPEVEIHFHVEVLLALVAAPTILFSALSCLYGKLSLRRNIVSMLKGGDQQKPAKRVGMDSKRGFISEMRRATLSSKKSVVFFVAFSCFCYSAMVQMGLSMNQLSSATMGVMILTIGAVLSVTSLVMAVTTVINANKGSIAVMKAFGYSSKQRALAVLLGYVPFAALGFALGTVYQHALLSVMVKVVFADVAGMPDYEFGVGEFFITLGSFIVLFTAAMAFYSYKISAVSTKEIMSTE